MKLECYGLRIPRKLRQDIEKFQRTTHFDSTPSMLRFWIKERLEAETKKLEAQQQQDIAA
jgi:hypothetical protein